MSYPPEHKTRTRARILDAAERLFKERGYDGVGIDAIMAEASLTRGGFYAHFDSKEALLAATVCGTEQLERMTSALAGADEDRAGAIGNLLAIYLSGWHRDNPGEGCPMAALASAVAKQGGAAGAAFGEQFAASVAELARRMPGESADEARSRALATLALMVGGITLSRAVGDEELSDAVLAACRRAATGVGRAEGPASEDT